MPGILIYRPDNLEKLPANSTFRVQGAVRPNNAVVTLSVMVHNPGPPPTFTTTSYTIQAAGGLWYQDIAVGNAGLSYTLNATSGGVSDMMVTSSQ